MALLTIYVAGRLPISRESLEKGKARYS
jgi:hypothetical protein